MSLLQKAYLALHRRTYARRLKRQKRFLGYRVVSVGNLSAGGTGKTPVIRKLVEHARRPMVVLRGYGGKLSRSGALVSDGSSVLQSWEAAGDEALLYARTTGLRVAVGRDRASAIERFAAESETVFLDDAFQNPSVYRDHELVLLDAAALRSTLEVLPTGRLREPWSALERADTVLITRVDEALPEHLAWLEGEISRFVPREHVFHSNHRARAIQPALPAGATLGAFCGIGNPSSFFYTIGELGVAVKVREVFADHHHYSPRDVARLDASLPAPAVWVTTEKDAVRLLGRADLPPAFLSRLHVLPVEIELAAGRERDFLQRVLGSAAIGV